MSNLFQVPDRITYITPHRYPGMLHLSIIDPASKRAHYVSVRFHASG